MPVTGDGLVGAHVLVGEARGAPEADAVADYVAAVQGGAREVNGCAGVAVVFLIVGHAPLMVSALAVMLAVAEGGVERV